jgi:tetratricopeptide (TPR) repeat protein
MQITKFLIVTFCLIIFHSCKPKEGYTDISDQLTGDTEIDFYTKEINKDPENDMLYWERANKYYERSMLDECIEDLRSAITIDSMKPEYYHLLSDAFLDINNSHRALMAITKAAELYPQRIPTLLKLSEMQLILTLYEESILTLNNLLKYQPQSADAYFLLGLNFRELEDLERAKNAFKTATEFDASIIDVWLALGEVYESEQSKEALKYYDTALRIDPENINALHSKAFWLQNNGDISGAVEFYRKINLLNISYAPAYLNAGIILLEMDSFQQAYEQFDILAGISPGNKNAYFFRGVAAQRLGRLTQAESDFENTLRLDPNNVYAADLLKEVIEAKK